MIGYAIERSDGVATFWIDRPEKKNSLTLEILDGLDGLIASVQTDDSCNIIVVRGRGGIFSSGFDLSTLSGGPQHTSVAATRAAEVFDRLAHAPIPSIAVIEGMATGAGFELMLATDFAIAETTARIGEFSIRLAMFGGAGPTYRLPSLIGIRRTKDLILGGKLISAGTAYEWGLVNEMADAEALDDTVAGFTGQLLDKSAYQLGLTKSMIAAGYDAASQPLKLLERFAFDLSCSSRDAQEGIASFLEKRKPEWRGR
ncbi:enoyl-CoA hydratase/isomerase family protein [Sphingopyxis sp. SCN 67-31]|uniref:enoyl-CoA hydratase/isomerase family protein n=1 Tax=Sphingopyxis sp. SCN 67-31 TaxID=1660142 RepID=UPI00086B120A|nr:enoyl-CoA hydratase/isomerase family protein [Sphingopyxis sp. SCN 67-31]ODU28369.1 MAG: hypothetical protein ABS88_13255 [Sphingopyxis sp. SCN 67-31]